MIAAVETHYSTLPAERLHSSLKGAANNVNEIGEDMKQAHSPPNGPLKKESKSETQCSVTPPRVTNVKS